MLITLCLVSGTHSRTFDSKGANSRVLLLLVTNYTSFGFTRGKFKNVTEERQTIMNHNILMVTASI